MGTQAVAVAAPQSALQPFPIPTPKQSSLKVCLTNFASDDNSGAEVFQGAVSRKTSAERPGRGFFFGGGFPEKTPGPEPYWQILLNATFNEFCDYCFPTCPLR